MIFESFFFGAASFGFWAFASRLAFLRLSSSASSSSIDVKLDRSGLSFDLGLAPLFHIKASLLVGATDADDFLPPCGRILNSLTLLLFGLLSPSPFGWPDFDSLDFSPWPFGFFGRLGLSDMAAQRELGKRISAEVPIFFRRQSSRMDEIGEKR